MSATTQADVMKLIFSGRLVSLQLYGAWKLAGGWRSISGFRFRYRIDEARMIKATPLYRNGGRDYNAGQLPEGWSAIRINCRSAGIVGTFVGSQKAIDRAKGIIREPEAKQPKPRRFQFVGEHSAEGCE